MESPFKPIPSHDEVAPAWRLLAQALSICVAAFVALILFGQVEVRLAAPRPHYAPDTGAPPNWDGSAAPFTPEQTRSYLRRDHATETVLRRLNGATSNVIVFRSRGAAMEFWVDHQADGEPSLLAGTGTVIRVEDLPTDELEGMAVLIEKEDGIHVHLSSAAGAAGLKSAFLPFLKSADGTFVRMPVETAADILNLKAHEKRTLQLHKVQEQQLLGTANGAEEKRVPRRTIRLMGKVAAVKEGA